jgi:hypothetical protein
MKLIITKYIKEVASQFFRCLPSHAFVKYGPYSEEEKELDST